MRRPLGRFIEAELLSGENRWRAGEHGLQDARKGMRFLQLPAVLQVKLALICKLTVFEELWLCETLHLLRVPASSFTFNTLVLMACSKHGAFVAVRCVDDMLLFEQLRLIFTSRCLNP